MIQIQFLNYLLSSRDSSLITLNNLDKRYFSDYINEWLFIKNHLDIYGNIPDKETFLSKFPDFDLVEVNENPKYLVEELFNDYRKNNLVKTFNKVAENLNNGDLDKALDLYKKSYDDISVSGIAIQSVDILKDTSRYNDYEERTEEYNKYFVSTGLKELDIALGGWDREEELATIIARPNKGKSWLLTKFAVAAVEQGLNCGYYSGEMSEKKVGYRFDTLVQHIANGSLTHGNKEIKMEYNNYIQDLPERFTGSLKVLTPQMLGCPATVSALRAFIEREHLDILFVDQHSLLEDEEKAKGPTERAANISRQLKNLQSLKKIPIIAVSQMNRTKNEGDTDAIDLAQIAQADRIGQDSTTVIGLSRDKKDKDVLRIHIVKSRDSGAVGKVLTYITNFNLGKFTFVPEDEKDIKNNSNDLESRYSSNESNNGEEEF